jgi:hypothetical protein
MRQVPKVTAPVKAQDKKQQRPSQNGKSFADYLKEYSHAGK